MRWKNGMVWLAVVLSVVAFAAYAHPASAQEATGLEVTVAPNPDGSYGDVMAEPDAAAKLACKLPELPWNSPLGMPDPPGPGCTDANLQTTAVPSASDNRTGAYGVQLINDGIFGTGGEAPTCCVSGNCWNWLSAGIYPTSSWTQLEWPTPIEVGQIFVDTKGIPAECGAGQNRAYHGADIQTWDGAAWVDHGSVTNATDDWGFTIPGGPVLTTRLRLNRAGVVSTLSQASNPILYEIKVYSCTAATGGGGGEPVDPNRQLGKQVHLPVMNFQGQDDVCRTWIEVQMVGPEFGKAVLVTWGEPGFCPPQCAGPLKVECTGLLKPGSTWNYLGAQVPTGSKGGMLFKFSAKQISELFPTFGGEDDIVADYMCETLFFGVVGDCDDWRRFKKAYNEGLEFAGLNMRIASGLGYLAVDVLRHCPGDVTPGVEVSSKYNGIAGDHLGSFDPVYGGYSFFVPLLYADKAGFNSVMYIQNGGLECSSIEIWFKAQDDCLRARICEIFTLAPGETYQWDASDCVGPDWQGSAWLRSTQPLGIVVDIIGRDVLMTYVGEPGSYEYLFDPEDTTDDEVFSMGDQMAFGPLMYSEYQGWDTGVQVQNLSPVVNAKVKVYFLDRSGDIITTLVDWICPRGSQTFFLPVVADLPGQLGGLDPGGEPGVVDAGRARRERAGHRGCGDVDQVRRLGTHDHDRGPGLQPVARAQDLPLADRRWYRRLVQRRGLDRAPEPAEGPGGHGRDERDRHRQRDPQARLHGLRHLHLRPERAPGLRVPEAEREAGRVHQPGDVGLREPGLQGQRHHQRGVLGA